MRGNRIGSVLLLFILACNDDGSAAMETITDGDETSDGSGSAATESTSTTHQTDSASSETGDPRPVCGNSVVEGAEACDDGNEQSLDGCEPDCTSSAGLPVWTQSYDGPAHGFDSYRDIALLPDGNLVVVGSHTVAGEEENVLMRVFDTEGTVVWTVSDDVAALSPLGGDDVINAVTVDAGGNIAVAGNVEVDDAADDWDVWVALYDPAGTRVWQSTWSGPPMTTHAAFGSGVAFDAVGNIIVAGSHETDTNGGDAWLQKLDETGVEVWSSSFDGAASGEDGFSAVAHDGSQIIAVGWESPGTTTRRAWIAAYDDEGNEIWHDYVHSADMVGYNSALDVSIAPDDSIFLTGRMIGTGGYDVWIAKYDPTGAKQWQKTWNGKDSNFDSGTGIIATATDIFIAGTTTVIGQQDDILAGRWSTDGLEVWVEGYNNDEASLGDFGSDVAVDGSGFVYVVGTETVLFQGTNGWIRKYHP